MLNCWFQMSAGKPSESLSRLVRSNRSETTVGSGEAVKVRIEVGVGVLVADGVGDKVGVGVGESCSELKVVLTWAAWIPFAR